MEETQKMSLTQRDLKHMISEATRQILKEYWTSDDDAAEAACKAAEKRIEQEFQDILKTDKRYIYQAKRLKESFERFMEAFEKEKEKLAEKFHGEARVQSNSTFNPDDFEIFIRDVDGEVNGGPENIDVVGGHHLKYQGNNYEEGTLEYDPYARLELTVEFSLRVVNHYEGHQVRPVNSWWEDADGNPVHGGDLGARRIPAYNPEWEKDHKGENNWISPDGRYRHNVRKGFIRTTRDVFGDKSKGYDEDYIRAFEALAVRNLAKLGRESYNKWTISFDDGWYGDENTYKVKFYV